MNKYILLMLLSCTFSLYAEEQATDPNNTNTTFNSINPTLEKLNQAAIDQAAVAIAKDFATWIKEFKEKALAEGIDEKILKKASSHFIFDPTIIALDRKQPEGMLDFDTYYTGRVPPKVCKGQKVYKEYKVLLEKISQKYSVPSSVIVALWGMETHFGKLKGKHSVLGSLATLAYEGRRAEYFTKELINALKIIQTYHISPHSLKGSWAGAMGHCQFMPTTFLNHAVDEDQDMKPDIWHSLPDVFASMANYLHNLGWNPQEPICVKVELPEEFDEALISPQIKKTWKDWQHLNIEQADEQKLEEPIIGYLQKAPLTDKVYLVFNNYELLLKWNKSNNFALSVGLFAAQLEGS